jgi:hypothetical protein
MSDADPGAINASDAEREATCDLLRVAAGEGRLTFEELADRIEAALRARTRGELARLARDLPETPPPVLAPAAGAELAPPPAIASSILGELRRTGVWTVPAYSSWSAVLGSVYLDLREAHIERSPVTIHVRTVLGSVHIVVPEGVEVDVRVSSLLGGVNQDMPAASRAAPTVIVMGRTILGSVLVRRERLHDKLVDRLLRGTR